ncbi:MAG TPA: Maf family protein [Steroidobacteraceae bacterium]|nr:Maf family protein [Steroidobacteraceae bacterium]
MRPDFVYLASLSPRRHQLLKQIGVPFQVLNVAIDESVGADEEPLAYVTRLAAAKAEAGLCQSEARGSAVRPVLAADTAVVIDGEILGKPLDGEDAQRMLRRLSGRTHEVLTAVALAMPSGLASRVSRSEVTFRDIGAEEARDYWNTGEPRDKAGGYAIQGYGAAFVSGLRGSYSGVMGLPLYETAEFLRSAGVALWHPGPVGGADEH